MGMDRSLMNRSPSEWEFEKFLEEVVVQKTSSTPTPIDQRPHPNRDPKSSSICNDSVSSFGSSSVWKDEERVAREEDELVEIKGSRPAVVAQSLPSEPSVNPDPEECWDCNCYLAGSSIFNFFKGKIVNNDVRIRDHVAKSYRGHQQEVCGLKWSESDKQASGGNDNLIHIWDQSVATSSSAAARNQNQWLHRFEGHDAAVKALAWCPFQINLLASGGGGSVDASSSLTAASDEKNFTSDGRKGTNPSLCRAAPFKDEVCR